METAEADRRVRPPVRQAMTTVPLRSPKNPFAKE